MNIILFTEEELKRPLARQDGRIKHIERVLHMGKGECFDIGVLNGPRGKACIMRQTATTVELEVTLEDHIPPLFPLTLITGYTRPQTMRRILREVTALGVARVWVVGTAKGEKSYRQSRLWHRRQYVDYLIQGAMQAFTTRIPEVRLFPALRTGLAALDSAGDRLAMDNYEAKKALSEYEPCHKQVFLAIGAERGWSTPEREMLREHGFVLTHMGQRVLRSDTACIVSVSLLLARMGLI